MIAELVRHDQNAVGMARSASLASRDQRNCKHEAPALVSNRSHGSLLHSDGCDHALYRSRIRPPKNRRAWRCVLVDGSRARIAHTIAAHGTRAPGRMAAERVRGVAVRLGGPVP